jgi:phage recombination protein Bet
MRTKNEGNMNDTNDWNEERRALVRRTICPKGISEDEFLLFMEQCQRSGLDPLLKEAFCVPRRVNIGSKDMPNWVTKHEFQPSEAGMLTRAERMPDFKGVQASAVYAGDHIIIRQGKGEVEHEFNPAKREGAIIGAWARVLRDGKVPTVVWLDFAAYSQATPLWGKMPATMIEKCARAGGLRKAYPSQFGGMYVAGERPDDVDTGEEVESSAPVTLEKPALPPPAPRETLETSAKEAVRLSREGDHDKAAEVLNRELRRGIEEAQTEAAREPGSDDGADDVDNEALAIVRECEAVASMEGYRALAKRGAQLPMGTEARKRATVALQRAHKRLSPAQGAA